MASYGDVSGTVGRIIIQMIRLYIRSNPMQRAGLIETQTGRC
jgi:hypothetical protein